MSALQPSATYFSLKHQGVGHCIFVLFWELRLLELMQVVLYEDELADNGVSLLTAKVVGGQLLFML